MKNIDDYLKSTVFNESDFFPEHILCFKLPNNFRHVVNAPIKSFEKGYFSPFLVKVFKSFKEQFD